MSDLSRKRPRKEFKEWTYQEVEDWLSQTAQEDLRLTLEQINQVKKLAVPGRAFERLTKSELIKDALEKGLTEIIGINLYNLLQAELEIRTSKRFRGELSGQPVDMDSPLGKFFQVLPSLSLREITYLENDREETVSILSLPQDIYWWGDEKLGSHLFVRSHYHKMEKILNQNLEAEIKKIKVNNEPPLRGFIITGTPGVGKSFFLPYLFWRWHREYKTIIITLASMKISLLWQENEGQVQIRIGQINDFLSLAANKGILHLFDGSENEVVPVPGFFTVAACSPSRNNYKGFLKKKGTCLIFMPLWTFNELEICRQTCYDIVNNPNNVSFELLKELYYYWGGIIRYTLDKTNKENNLEELDQAINYCDFTEIIKLVKIRSAIDSVTNGFVHRVLHLNVLEDEKNPFSKVITQFGSLYIADQILERLNDQRMIISTQFVKNSSREADLASTRGQVFELLVHRQLIAGNVTLKARSLEDEQTQIIDLTFNPRTLNLLSGLQDISTLSSSQYGQPLSKTFTAADAILSPDAFIQVTINKNHGLATEGARKIIIEMLKNHPNLSEVRCYFIVPPDIFNDFKKQNYLNVGGKVRQDQENLPEPLNILKQWVVCLDLD